MEKNKKAVLYMTKKFVDQRIFESFTIYLEMFFV